MSASIPSTEDIRDGYSRRPPGHAVRSVREQQAADFDAWLRAHDAQVQIEAARVAFQIASHYEASGRIVLRAGDFENVHAAVNAALVAEKTGSSLPRPRIDIRVEHNIHGTVITEPETGWGNGDGLTTAVVDLHSRHIDVLSQITIFSDVEHQIEDLAEAADTCISTIIYILTARGN